MSNAQHNEADVRQEFFRIRQLIYEERQKPAFALERKKKGHNTSRNWDVLCGAMDALLDASSAFGDFFSLQRVPSHFEALGFLQGLITVQDSVNEFRRALGLSACKTDNLEKIRDYRNRIVGHPVITNQSVPPSSCMIDLSSFNSSGFSCVLYFAEENCPSKKVNICYSTLSFETFSEMLSAWNEVLNQMVISNTKYAHIFSDPEWQGKLRLLNYHFGKFAYYSEEESVYIFGADIELCKEIISKLHRRLSREGMSAERSQGLLDLIRNLDDYIGFVKETDLEPRTKRLLYDGLVAQKDGFLDAIKSIENM